MINKLNEISEEEEVTYSEQDEPHNPDSIDIHFEEQSGEETESDYEESLNLTMNNLEIKMQALDVIKLVNTTFKPFSGDASELNGFLINVDVCKSAIPNEHQALAVKCIRGRLQGNAAALVQDSVSTYDGLVSALKTHIKADSSKVLEANLAAILFDNRNLTKFTEDVNLIADKLPHILTREFHWPKLMR